MAFDFPSSPAENQEYTPAGGPTYVYKAPRWTVKATDLLASPVFTGDPRAPTPSTADNDTSVATTAYVQTNLATKANTSDVALKANIASPDLTGNPTAPTPATSDNDTSIATTAYVKANMALITSGATISDTAPTASQGALWWNSANGNLYISYNDGTSTQWVQINNTGTY